MKPFPIPLVPFGPGSQVEEGEQLNYLAMPKDMDVYSPPRLPESDAAAAAPGAMALMQELVELLDRVAEGGPGAVLDASGLSAEDRAVLNQVLAEGEVSAIVGIDGDTEVRVQESVFSGIWRLLSYRGDAVVHDAIEVGAVPRLFHEAAAFDLWSEMPRWNGPLPPNVVNASTVIEEIRDHAAAWKKGDAPHVINLTLLPMSMEDISFMDHHLGTGDLLILSRGYGNCRISNTRLANCWRVVYYNSMDKVILNTVEITDMPEAALVAPEDMRDSRERLADVLELLQE